MKSIIALLAVLALVGCKEMRENAPQLERKKQEEMTLRGVESVGMPSIINFAEKRMMKDILELRDRNVPTTTYILDMNGRPHKVCDSIGFGLPYATQYTNPQMPQQPFGGNTYVLPQADPNGLYSPAAADGTWVQCVDPKTKKATVVYVEPRIIVSPFPIGE